MDVARTRLVTRSGDGYFARHLMSETLAPGMRLLPPIGNGADIDQVFANPDWP